MCTSGTDPISEDGEKFTFKILESKYTHSLYMQSYITQHAIIFNENHHELCRKVIPSANITLTPISQ